MPSYDAITYSWHAVQRMKQRRITAQDVELILRIGEGQYDEDDGTWTYSLGTLAVVIVDWDATVHDDDGNETKVTHMNATVTYDPEVKALYLHFVDTDVVGTVELAKGVFLDVDAVGGAVGLEILNADTGLLASLPAPPDTMNLGAWLRTSAA